MNVDNRILLLEPADASVCFGQLIWHELGQSQESSFEFKLSNLETWGVFVTRQLRLLVAEQRQTLQNIFRFWLVRLLLPLAIS